MSAKSGSIQEKSGRLSSSPTAISSAPHSATAPVEAPMARLGSFQRGIAWPVDRATAGGAPACAPFFTRAPPRSRISLPANMLPARNKGMM